MRNTFLILAITLTACDSATANEGAQGSMSTTSLSAGRETIDCYGNFPVEVEIPQPAVWQVEACVLAEGYTACDNVTPNHSLTDDVLTFGGCADDFVRVTWVHLK